MDRLISRPPGGRGCRSTLTRQPCQRIDSDESARTIQPRHWVYDLRLF